MNSFGGYQLRLIQCDMEINEDVIFDMDNPFKPDEFTLKGGGGTDFIPCSTKLQRGKNLPKWCSILQTVMVLHRKNDPGYPVIWGVIEGGVMPAKWGQKMDISRGS